MGRKLPITLILLALATAGPEHARAAMSWQPLGGGVTGTQINHLCVWQGTLVAGGNFTAAGGVPVHNIAVWDGTTWSALGDGFNRVDGIADYNGQLIVAGERADGVQEVSYWHPQSGRWKTLTQWRDNPVVFQNTLYGTYPTDSPPGSPCVGTDTELHAFDGSTWSLVKDWHVCYGSAFLMDMEVSGGRLYTLVLHSYQYDDDAGWVEYYDGTSWSGFNSFSGYWIGGTMGIANGQVFASGSYQYQDVFIAEWDGAAWNDVYSQPLFAGCWPYAMFEYDSTLVAGGGFGCESPPASVMSYDGADWTAVGDKMNGNVVEMTVYDGTLIAAGSFDSTGTTATPLIAQYVDTPSSVGETPARAQAILHRNVPNPFNPNTVIPYSLPEAGRVSIVIYAADGRHIRTLLDARRPAGDGSVTWDGIDETGNEAPSGIYFCDLRFRGVSQTRKLVLIK